MIPRILTLPSERSRERTRLLYRILIGVIIFAVSLCFDETLYHALYKPDWREVYARKDWAMFFRTMGYVPLWLVVALMIDVGLGLQSRMNPRETDTRPHLIRSADKRVLPNHAGLLLLGASLSTGLVCELMQIVTLRHRPSPLNQGTYMFDWVLTTELPGASHGLASSHAGVVFGIAWMFYKFHPWLGIPVLILATACSMTRLYAGAHFFSDCVAAGVAAWIIADLLYRRSTGAR